MCKETNWDSRIVRPWSGKRRNLIVPRMRTRPLIWCRCSGRSRVAARSCRAPKANYGSSRLMPRAERSRGRISSQDSVIISPECFARPPRASLARDHCRTSRWALTLPFVRVTYNKRKSYHALRGLQMPRGTFLPGVKNCKREFTPGYNIVVTSGE